MMKDILTIVDPVRLSFIEALLKDEGIAFMVRDVHMSNLLGQHNGLFPKRLAVDAEKVARAESVLKAAEQLYDE